VPSLEEAEQPESPCVGRVKNHDLLDRAAHSFEVAPFEKAPGQYEKRCDRADAITRPEVIIGNLPKKEKIARVTMHKLI
jgi:hypothetical protein